MPAVVWGGRGEDRVRIAQQVEANEQREQEHQRHDEGVDGQDAAHAAGDHEIGEEQGDEDARLVRKAQLFVEDGPRSGEHHRGYPEQDERHEHVDDSPEGRTEQVRVKLLIGKRAEAVGQAHDARAEPHEQHRGKDDAQRAIGAVLGEKVQDFLPRSKACSHNGADVRKGDLPDDQPCSVHARPLRSRRSSFPLHPYAIGNRPMIGGLRGGESRCAGSGKPAYG